MRDINCPSCGAAFRLEDSGYAELLKQVRDDEFENLLQKHVQQAKKKQASAVQLAEANLMNQVQAAAAMKDGEIQRLAQELKSIDIMSELAIRDASIALENERDELTLSLTKTEAERKRLVLFLDKAGRDRRSAVELAEANLRNDLQIAAALKEAEIERLKEELKTATIQ